jgi:MFS family permease
MMGKMAADRSLQSRPRVFYGWFVVAGAFAVTFVGFGSAYTFSAFIASLQRDFAASRGSVSLVFSMAGFLYFALGVVSGPLADRFGARLLAVIGMILTGVGLAFASVARSLPEVYAAYGLGVGLGIGFSYVPILGAVQRWFDRRRGLASGLAVSGIGVGTLVMPPAAAMLIDAMGWRGAYLVLGCFAAIVGGGMALLVEDDPRRRGTGTDGDPPLLDAQQVQSVTTGVRDALRSRRFVGLCAASLLGSFGVFVPFVHLVPYAMDHGIPQSSAVLLMAAIGIGSTSGRFFLGGLADRLGRAAFSRGDGCRHGARIPGLGHVRELLAVGRFCVCVRAVLRRLGSARAGGRGRLFRRAQSRHPDRGDLHVHRGRHSDRSECRGFCVRSKP